MARQVPSKSRHRISNAEQTQRPSQRSNTRSTSTRSTRNSSSPTVSHSVQAHGRTEHQDDSAVESPPTDVSGSSPGSSTGNTSVESRKSTPLVPTVVPRTSTPSASRVLAPLLRSPVDTPNDSDNTVMEQLQAFFATQGDFNRRFEQRLEDLQRQGRETRPTQHATRFSKTLSAHVRDIYATLTGEDGESVKWDVSKSFVHQDNQAVNAAIIDGIRSTDTSTPLNVLRAAMRVHFRTKRQQKKNKDAGKQSEVLRGQRIRSRKNTKRLKRQKALSQSTSIGAEEKAKYVSCLESTEYISSEHSMSEENSAEGDGSSEDELEVAPKRKVLCKRPLQWRSAALNSLFSRLDKKTARRQSQRASSMTIERRDGPPSNREVPEDAPAFALS